MEYHFKTHKEKEGFWAECIELPGCITEGDTVAELQENMQEALNLYVEEPCKSADLAAFPDDSIKPSKTIIEVPLDPQIAFSFLVRYYRIKHGLTQKKAAKLLGFDNVYSYQRLETKKCNPSLKTLAQMKSIFPEISLDFVLV